MADVYWVQGTEGETVAKIQQWIYYWAKKFKVTLPAGFLINGSFDASTVAALKLIQQKLKLPATGTWGPQMIKKSRELALYISGGKSSNAFGYLGDRQTIAADRQYVYQWYEEQLGRPPTSTELANNVYLLQAGMARKSWVSNIEKKSAEVLVNKVFEEIYHRPPTPAEMTKWKGQIEAGQHSQLSMREYLAQTEEALNYVAPEEVLPGDEDALAVLTNTLTEFGLEGLADWAWEQIKAGHSEERIIQELRETDVYKARFAGMEQRRAAGLTAITERQYLDLELSYRDIMRRNGLPPGFWDDPSDYVALIAADVSPEELNGRVVEGYNRVMDAPIEVRQAFAEMYGTDGDAALAALFMDPDIAQKALEKQARAAETKGWGGLFQVDFDQLRAEEIADLDMSDEQLRQGLAQIAEGESLFTESVTETKDLTAAGEGADAVFQLGGTGAKELEERRRTRIATLSGGGGANMTQEGLGVGAAD